MLFIILFCESAFINETRFPLPLLDFLPFIFTIGFLFLFNFEFLTARKWLVSGASYFARRWTTLRKFPVHVSSNTSSSANKGCSYKSISDHLPVFIILKLKLPKPPSCSVIARSYQNYNSSTYAADLAQLTGYFSNLQNNFPKINDHLGAFNNAFSSILNNHAIRNRSTPFVNDEIKQVMKKRDHLHRIFRQTRRLDDWSLFKNASNAAKSMLKEAEKSYARNQVQNCEGKPGAIWKVINQYLPSRESPDHILF